MKKLKRLVIRKSFRKAAKGLSCMTAAGIGMFVASQAQGQVIQDNFTSASHYGNAIGQQTGNSTGLAPTTDLADPGQNWQHITGAWYDATEYSNSGSNSNYFFAQNNVQFHNGAASGLSLGSYNTGGGALTLSADVGFNNGSGPIGEYQVYNSDTQTYSNFYDATRASAALGFATSLNTASNYGPDFRNGFTGLAVLGTGALQEYVNGSAVGAAEAFGGTFSAYLPLQNKLTYTINTTTGAITNVSFGDSTTDYSFLLGSSFSSQYLSNLEIGGTAGGGADTAAFTDLVLSTASGSESAVPEPSTYALLASGMLMLGAYQYRRRNRGV